VERFKERYAAWRQPKPHPLTGDLLDPGERVTWRVMSVYRRWSVFFLLQVLTIIWWTHPFLFPGGLAGWNYVWSDLAVVVEMMVGIAFMNQAMRDAKIIRSSLANLATLVANHDTDMDMIRSIYSAVHPDGEGTLAVTIDGRKHALTITDHGTLPDPAHPEETSGKP
jgi:hypothetical protein